MATPTGHSEKTASTFQMSCAVSVRVKAPPERIWGLLTDSARFPKWNSTVTSIEGDITLGTKLKIRVPISDRTFSPKVSELVPPTRMVWSDGAAPMFKGVRTYTLAPVGDGSTDFTMVETFSGLMLPLIKGSLPDFGPVFDKYAADLKREAEGGAK